MINQYYFKRLKLFKLPYKILLSYHSPLGNTIKNWVSYRMLSNILIVRNDVHILNLGLTIIQLRKAVNALFYRIQARGTFVVYAQASNALKMNHDSVFVFVKSWLPGLITNYRQLSLSVAINRFHKSIINPYLSRTQLNAIKNVKLKSFLKL
jgi:ribosomal protein S2